MIELLAFICTHCKTDNFNNDEWSNVILATFDYVCLVNNTKTCCGCYTETCQSENKTVRYLQQDTELCIAETTWFLCIHALLERTETDVKDSTKNMLERTSGMRPTRRAMLLALIHDNFRQTVNNLLGNNDKTTKIQTDAVPIMSTDAIETLKKPGELRHNCPVQDQLHDYLHGGKVNTLRSMFVDDYTPDPVPWAWTEEDKEVRDEASPETTEEATDLEDAIG